jgi:hypothetical protein
MGSGDPDLYKAFAWRFWNLAARGNGRIGVVLPRSAWAERGTEEFGSEILEAGRVSDVTQLPNNRRWVFDDVHPQYTIALTCLQRSEPRTNEDVLLLGPFRRESAFRIGVSQERVRFKVRDVLAWTDSAAFPLLSTEDSGAVFAQLRRAPRLDA